MNEQDISSENRAKAAKALIREKKSFSIVWIVPLVAVIIGGWLVYKAISEKGPEISIVFKSAEGLEAGKTEIKYKDVVIGKVKTIVLDNDLTQVILTAELNKGTKSYLTDQTRFWVVRARLRAGEVSGIGTLFGGAYIAIDPVRKGKPATSFVGLETPPVVTTDKAGRHFMLKAEKLGSLDVGSPVYYRQIEVGQVESYKLDDDGENVSIRVFIEDPHHFYVKKNTRFWNAGGIDFSVDASGLRVDTQSIVSLMIGGIAFDNPKRLKNNDAAENDEVFNLYDNYQDAVENEYTIKFEWLLEFEGSVRGLAIEAPVEFKGIKVGKVLDIELNIEPKTGKTMILVLIEIEPERFLPKNLSLTASERKALLNSMVANGLRAQLQSGSLLTGMLYVDLDYHPDNVDEKIIWEGPYPKFPTVQAPLEEALAVLKKLLTRIEEIPFQQIGEDMHTVVKNLNKSIIQSEALFKQLNTTVTPEISATLEQAKKSLAAMEKVLSADSPVNQDVKSALDELAGAAQSMRVLTDYLERHPEALIYGKGVNQ